MTTLKLSNRSPKQPIKNLPTTLEIPAGTTVEDVKILINRAVKLGDYNRIGLFDPSTKKTIKDRRALIADEPSIAAAGEVLVKDLGYQIDWRTVFVIEYIGPILIHAGFVAGRQYIYKGAGPAAEMSRTQWLTFGMIMAHYVKRELETLFVHKFSANTMPWRNLFKNSGHYWLISGLLCAWPIYGTGSLAATTDLPAVDAIGVAIFIFGEVLNGLVHRYLASLRSTGGTERKIPSGYGFELVTSPNYMYEVIAWLGVILVSRSWAVTVFIVMGAVQMFWWAQGKEKAYRKEFGDKYKKKRYVMLPGLC